MDAWEPIITNIVERLGFVDYRIEVRQDRKRLSLFIYDNPNLIRENLLGMVEALNHLLRMIAKKENLDPIFLDINNYRQEREGLIAELARAAAKKVLQTKEEIQLPLMNSYERRLVHVELAVHPEVTTESVGVGRGRYVIVKPIKESQEPLPAHHALPQSGTEYTSLS